MVRPVLLLLALAIAAPAHGDEGLPVNPLGWLEGCWDKDDGTMREVWSLGRDSHLFGHSFAVSDGQIVFFEQMRIDHASGMPVFNAYPAGKGPSAFPMVERGEMSITFASEEHDYPQRIAYQREGDRLVAQIALFDGGEARSYAFRRCDSA